jgi:hypothetical protein
MMATPRTAAAFRVDIQHVSSEFGPTVPWGGPYGTINAAAGHQIREGRWIRDRDYTAGLVRFWVGSQNGGGPSGGGSAAGRPFEPGVGHFANGTRGASGSTPYSSWILSASVQAAAVQGDLQLGKDMRGQPVAFGDLLGDMVEWWETRSLQLRTDCIILNGDRQQNPADANRTCLDLPPSDDMPYCYTMADGALNGGAIEAPCSPLFSVCQQFGPPRRLNRRRFWQVGMRWRARSAVMAAARPSER